MALISYRSRSLLHEVAALLTLKANWFNALTVKKWDIAHSFLRLLLPSACYAGYVIVSCGMRKHLTGSSYITGTPSPHLHLVQTPPNVIMCVWAAPISISTTLKKRCKFQSLVLSCTIHVGMLELIQWNLLIPTPVGPKNFARLLGWPYYRGRVKCTIHCIRTCWTAVLFNEQLEYRYCVQ